CGEAATTATWYAKKKRPGSSLGASGHLESLFSYQPTLTKTIDSVHSTSVSINTRPRIIAVRMAPAAAGLRAMPSQAAAATRDCAIPQAAAAIAIENPAERTIQRAMCSGGFPASCANAGSAKVAEAASINRSPASFFLFLLLFL